jgi:tRNA dimethylallyltransferase
MDSKPKIIVILGPTSSGKSALAVKIAKKYNGEVISADSRQVYKGLDIGTGKITKKEMNGVPHHLLDVVSPKKIFTAADYQKLAKKSIEDILKRKKVPIICGGTGFYIDVLINNYKLPNVKPNYTLRKKLSQLTTSKLFTMLKKLDPKRAKNIDKANRQRLIRSIEIVKSTKKPISPLVGSLNYQVLKIGIQKSKKNLNKLIYQRLQKRLKSGLVEEVANLHKKGLSWKRMDELGLEYRYISKYLTNQLDYKTAIQNLYQEIVHYAKRQMTYFKRDKEIIWVKNNKKAIQICGQFLNEI